MLWKKKFNANKCKVQLKMLDTRMKLLIQKKTNLAKQQKREIGMLLRDNKEANARALVEHIIRTSPGSQYAQNRKRCQVFAAGGSLSAAHASAWSHFDGVISMESFQRSHACTRCVSLRVALSPAGEDYTIESYELLRQHAALVLARFNVLEVEKELKPEVAEYVRSLIYGSYVLGAHVPELLVSLPRVFPWANRKQNKCGGVLIRGSALSVFPWAKRKRAVGCVAPHSPSLPRPPHLDTAAESSSACASILRVCVRPRDATKFQGRKPAPSAGFFPWRRRCRSRSS